MGIRPVASSIALTIASDIDGRGSLWCVSKVNLFAFVTMSLSGRNGPEDFLGKF